MERIDKRALNLVPQIKDAAVSRIAIAILTARLAARIDALVLELLPQQDSRRLDQQHAQVSATPLGDAAEDRSSSGAVLPWHKAEPGGKIAAAVERLPGADRRHKGGRDQRPNPRDTLQ